VNEVSDAICEDRSGFNKGEAFQGVLATSDIAPKLQKKLINVATILFQNTDSRQKLTEKKRQFATATIHF